MCPPVMRPASVRRHPLLILLSGLPSKCPKLGVAMIHSSLNKLLMGVVLLLGASTVLAEIKLTGELTQGSLIRGEVVPGSRVWLNETPLRVTPNGHFVFGIGRDGELSHTLRVETPAGQVRTQQVSLRKRDYRIQRIEGDRKSTRLNSSHVKISYAVFCLKKKTKAESHIHRQHT